MRCYSDTEAFISEGSARFLWVGFPNAKTWFARLGIQAPGRQHKGMQGAGWGQQQSGKAELQLLSCGPTVARSSGFSRGAENPIFQCWLTNFEKLINTVQGKHNPSVDWIQFADT